MPKQQNIYVISLGGSLIAPPEGINWKFLKKFRLIILEEIKKGKRFIITSGGGMTCRNYQMAAKKITSISNNDLDWIGLYANRLHAQLMRSLFSECAHPDIIENPAKKIKFTAKVVTGGGYKPGFSSDMSAVLLAKNLQAKILINLTNIDYVYEQDPRKYPDAKKIEKISWSDYRKIVGNKWTPGLNAPFDPIASKEAEKAGLEVVIMNGQNLKNLQNFLHDKKYKGTNIS
jgi:uridylate kinase